MVHRQKILIVILTQINKFQLIYVIIIKIVQVYEIKAIIQNYIFIKTVRLDKWVILHGNL